MYSSEQKAICELFKFRQKDCHQLEKPTANQAANTGLGTELGGTTLHQPSQKYAHETSNLCQTHNKRAEVVSAKKSTQHVNVTHATLLLGLHQLAR